MKVKKKKLAEQIDSLDRYYHQELGARLDEISKLSERITVLEHIVLSIDKDMCAQMGLLPF
jgi:hypothetical protein